MTHRISICLFAALVSIAAMPQERPEWDHVAVFKVNVERPRASMMIFPSAELAAEGGRSRSPWFRSLNGPWKFHCADSPAARPAGFHRRDFDDAAWNTIPVPSNYQLHGCDIPIYTNAAYPFPMNTAGPPAVPKERNSVGSYRRPFTIPNDWSGRQIFAHFDGVDSAFYRWSKQRDASRPFHYEGSSRTDCRSSDFNSRMYPTPADVIKLAQSRPDKPFLLVEYTHAMGNSNGALREYWDILYSGINAIGAWRSVQPLAAKDPSMDISIWRAQGDSWKVRNVQIRRIDERSAAIAVSGELAAAGAQHDIIYTVHGNGEVEIESSYRPGEKRVAMMPRFGMELILAPGFEHIAWYGRGPAPTYADRDYERVGIYRSTVAKQWNEFSKPQENSNKVDVRWVALTDRSGDGLLAQGSPLLSVGAYHYPKDEIENADCTFRLTRRPQIYLNLDLKQMGVGGVDSWTIRAYPLDEYRIPGDRPYSYKYRLTPLKAGDLSGRLRAAE